MNKPLDLVWHRAAVTRAKREALNESKSVLLWFTGLSGSGKSTLAHAVEERLHQLGRRTIVLDGDNIRHGLCADLGFEEHDRVENIRRVGEVAKLFLEAGVITLAAFISPFKAERERLRSLFPQEDFVEIYCRCPLEVCEQRDVKGLYKRARSGEISNFTGISSRYEEPLSPDLIVDTNKVNHDASVQAVLRLLSERGTIQPNCIASQKNLKG
jgi:adenylylsulfate kinase